MDENTAFVVIDFAMKFLSRRYRESMANWFGKAGMGMHVSCVIMKDAERANPNEMHKKHTYLTFTGKAKQDQGAVMAIYQSVLKQLKEDFPHLESIIGKSENAGCYHNEVLFAWKVHWPRSNLNLKFYKLSSMKGSQLKTNATVTVPLPNVKCSILLTVATTLTALIRCLKQCGQQQPCCFTANVLDMRG